MLVYKQTPDLAENQGVASGWNREHIWPIFFGQNLPQRQVLPQNLPLRQVLPPLSPAFPKLILLLQVLHAMLCLCELLLLLLWFLLILFVLLVQVSLGFSMLMSVAARSVLGESVADAVDCIVSGATSATAVQGAMGSSARHCYIRTVDVSARFSEGAAAAAYSVDYVQAGTTDADTSDIHALHPAD